MCGSSPACVPAAHESTAPKRPTGGDRQGEVWNGFLQSDRRTAVVCDGREAEVVKALPEGGCTMVDAIPECTDGAKNHGRFVSCVGHQTNGRNEEGLITGEEEGRSQSCTSQADIT